VETDGALAVAGAQRASARRTIVVREHLRRTNGTLSQSKPRQEPVAGPNETTQIVRRTTKDTASVPPVVMRPTMAAKYFAHSFPDRLRLLSDDDPLPPGFTASTKSWVRAKTIVQQTDVERLARTFFIRHGWPRTPSL
jgi:hypothetical protein